MADGRKVRLDDLEAQKLDAQGDHITAKTAKEQAKALAAEARLAFPGGVPDDSPYKRFTLDQCLAEAARLDMRLGPMMAEDDLRLVLEVLRQKLTRGDVRPPAPPPPVPMQAAPPVKIRGLRPSASGTWIASCSIERPPQVSVGPGQMTRIRNGARIEAGHYSPAVLQSIVDQGVKLVPIEEYED